MITTAVKAQQILLTNSSLQVTVILNVSEFHLVLNSSTCGIHLKRITQQLQDVNMFSEIFKSLLEIISQSGNQFRVRQLIQSTSHVVLCQ